MREKHYCSQSRQVEYWELLRGGWREVPRSEGGDWPSSTFKYIEWTGRVALPRGRRNYPPRVPI